MSACPKPWTLRRSRLTSAALIVLSLLGMPLHAEKRPPGEPTATAIKHHLELVWIVDAQPQKYLFVIGQLGFSSVAALENFLRGQAGTTLEWAPGCKRNGDEPLLSSPADMTEFKRFCSEHKIRFVLVPSG